VHYVQDGKVGAFVRADEDPILYWRHVITSLEFAGQYTRLPRKAGSLARVRASLLGLLQGDKVLA
jgi:hypothetical protein